MSAVNELVITPEFVTNIIAVDLADETTFTTADKAKLNGIEAGAQANTVTKVAGKTGAVELDAGDIAYDASETYESGKIGAALKSAEEKLDTINAGDIGYDGSTTYDTDTVGKELTELNRHLSDVEEDQIPELKNALNDGKSDFDSVINYSRQLLDPDKATPGYYWDIRNGELAQGGGGTSTAAVYEPISVKAGVTYYCKYLYGYFCILDDGGVLSRVTTDTTTAYTGSFTPENDGVVYITTANAAPNPRILTDAPYGATVTQDTKVFNASLAIDGYVHIKIANDGVSGDYTNPIAAVRNIKDASEHKQYMLDIYPGVYNLQEAITSAEQVGAYWGFSLPDYVHIRGIGEREKIILNCALPDTATATEVEHTSTINLNANNIIENITFTGTNVRYVVHDESSNTIKNWRKTVKNCKFIHNGNVSGLWEYTDAWGEGCSSGSYSYFENCVFENNSKVPPYAFHTNTAFESGCTHIFKNCSFVQNYSGNDGSGSFGIYDLQSGKAINVKFIGCMFSRFIYIHNYTSAEDIYELNICGHGNTPVYLNVYRPNVSNPKRIFTKFSDEVSIVYNNSSSDIAMGRPLNYASFPNNKVGVPQSSGTWVCGISLDVIPANGLGYMKYAGVLPLADVGVSGIAIGDKVGVVNWAIAKVTDGTEFARAIQNNLIKFI